MLPLHLRINDAGTKQPAPVRLRVTGPAGEYFAPLGRLAVFSVGKGEAVGGNVRVHKENWAYIDGQCEIRLPSGVPLRVQATKGPCYTPLDTTVTLGPGQLSLRFEIAKAIDSAFMMTDSHAHFLDSETAKLEMAAEDLDSATILTFQHRYLSQDGNTYEAFPNLNAFTGAEPTGVAYATLNVHPALGRVALLNTHRPVHPLRFGDESDDWSVMDWCRQCHRKKGFTVWVDAFRTDAGLPGGEALVAAILGEIDAIEIDAKPRKEPLLPWIYRLWSAGFANPIVGGSGKDSNGLALGAMRTCYRGESWHDSVRAGSSFVTNGPMLDFKVTIGSTMAIEATARSLTPFDRLEIVENGQVIATAAGDEPRLQLEHTPAHSGWLAARVIGKDGAFAHTSPLKVEVPGVPFPHRRMFLPLLRQCVEGVKEWAVERGHYTVEKWRTQLVANCDAAMEKLK